MRRSLMLAAYLGFTSIADGWADRKLKARLDEGREDPERINERFGKPELARPAGPLVWFHAASVGESLSILELLRVIREEYPKVTILVTTGTQSSAGILASRLPDGTLHQFVPIDTKKAVNGFLGHWKPDLAIWTESEFWPRLLVNTHRRRIPMVLINGRVSASTVRSWRWLPGMAQGLMGRFEHLAVQTEDMRKAFLSIGAPAEKLTVTGSLKEGAVSLPFNPVERKGLIKNIGNRPVWLASSTHDGEEPFVAAAHQAARKKYPELLLILVPRHPERADEIMTDLTAQGFEVARRSARDPITARTEIYLADTLGEMGLWYRIAPLSFVGGSLVPIGGHNPFEPAALGSAILHGPYVSSFDDIYTRLSDGDAAVCVSTEQELAKAVIRYLNPDEAATLASNAWSVSSEGADVTEKVMALLAPYMPKGAG